MSKLSKEGLIYFSNKLNKNIVDRLNSVKKMISDLADKVNNDKDELNHKIDNNKNEIDSHSTQISSNTSNIVDLNVKYSELKTEVDNSACDGHPNGDIVYINDVDQYVFRNIRPGETREIPNTSFNNDVLIECFTEIDGGTVLDYTVIELNENTTDQFIYNPRYIDVSSDGIKPRDEVLISFNKTNVSNNDGDYIVFTSDVIPADIIDTIESFTDIREELA